MNLLIVSSAFITAEAFAPSTNEGRLSLTALNNYARTKWSPGAAAPSTSNFSPFSSFPAGSATTSGVSSSSALNNYARTKWSPGTAATAPSTSNFSPFSSFPAGAATSVSSSSVPYDDIRAELKSMMDNPSWDDGSLAPIFIRLAWHSSGTYDAATGTGGSNGAGMRFQNEAADPENAGLEVARAFLEPVKAKFPSISYSDLWILAAYVGLEHTGGPVLDFQPGRVDYVDESYWNEMSYGRLPAAEKYCCPHLDDSNAAASIDASSGTVKGWEGLVRCNQGPVLLVLFCWLARPCFACPFLLA